MPSTLKSFIRGIQWIFKFYWAYGVKLLNGPGFPHQPTGLKTVVDKNTRIFKHRATILVAKTSYLKKILYNYKKSLKG